MRDPAQDELLALHRAHAARDPIAGARLAELLLPALRRRFPRTRAYDHHTIDSTIGYSIARYLAEPDRYDPTRGPLLPWLYQDVRGDLLNEYAREVRRRESPAGDARKFEDQLVGGNPPVEETVMDRLDPFDLPPQVIEEAKRALVDLDEVDQNVLQLMADRVRATSAYAEVMGIAHLPVEQQRAAVKRTKDRLTKRMETLRDRLHRTN